MNVHIAPFVNALPCQFGATDNPEEAGGAPALLAEIRSTEAGRRRMHPMSALLRCPIGHALTRDKVVEPLTCDDCHSTIPKGRPAYSCVQCDHDRCYACAGEPRSSPAQNDPKRETLEDSKLRSPLRGSSVAGFAGALDAASAAKGPPTPPTPQPAAPNPAAPNPAASILPSPWTVGMACVLGTRSVETSWLPARSHPSRSLDRIGLSSGSRLGTRRRACRRGRRRSGTRARLRPRPTPRAAATSRTTTATSRQRSALVGTARTPGSPIEPRLDRPPSTAVGSDGAPSRWGPMGPRTSGMIQ